MISISVLIIKCWNGDFSETLLILVVSFICKLFTALLGLQLFLAIIENHDLHPNEGLLSKLFQIVEEFSLMLPLSAAKEIDKILNEDITKVSRFSTINLRYNLYMQDILFR